MVVLLEFWAVFLQILIKMYLALIDLLVQLVLQKKHKKTMEGLEENELMDMAAALKKIIVKLKKINVSYNFFVHYSPEKENLHFHIEITPRIATWGGFELSTNAVINSVMPEDAARFYRR